MRSNHRAREDREPDDLKEGARTSKVGRRDRGEYEDVEAARATARRSDDDEDVE
jgi:hypothetical protein